MEDSDLFYFQTRNNKTVFWIDYDGNNRYSEVTTKQETDPTEKSKESKEVAKESYTVEQKISTIKDTLISRDKIKFSELFLESTSKEEIITTFMALLELIKLQFIKVAQDDLFSDIQIEKTGEEIDGELI